MLLVGCGALGTHAADALARAGVGTLLLVDRDIVEWSNLQRQVLFTEDDAREEAPKAVAAADALARANSECRVVPHVADCTLEFLDAIAERPDVIVDGTDNFATRYLLNDWCRREGIPWIYAGAVATEGAAMVLVPAGPCLRCLWPEAPSQQDVGNCETAGILAPAIAAVSAFQVAETLKLLLGEATTRGVYTCDVWRGHYTVVPVAADAASDCVVCSRQEFPALTERPAGAAALCGRDAVQIDPGRNTAIDLDRLHQQLGDRVERVSRTAYLLRFVADDCRFTVFPDGRALLFGVRDPLRAKALYDRWLGA